MTEEMTDKNDSINDRRDDRRNDRRDDCCPAAIRGGPFSEAYLATSMAPTQLHTAAAHPRRRLRYFYGSYPAPYCGGPSSETSSLLLWLLPSCIPRRPILGDVFATSMAPTQLHTV